MRKSLLFLIVIILAIGFSSCSDDETPVNTIKIGLVTQIVNSGIIKTKIDYNSANRPEKMSFYNATGYPDGYQTYDYGDDSLVDKISVFNQQKTLTSYTTYDYDNTLKRLLTKRYYNVKSGNGILSHSEAYTYNEKNQVVNQSDFDSTSNVTYYKILVYDTLDDPTEVKYFKGDNSLVGSLTYTYDGKPGVFAKFYKNQGLSHSNNKYNITKITSSLTPVAGKVTIDVGKYKFVTALYSSSFEYDANKLATKEIRAYIDGNIITEQFGYK
jgi:hypothetical protein